MTPDPVCHCGSTALGLDLEQPDYDMDSEDEALLNRLNRKMEIRPLQFETMVDRLEKASTHQVTHTQGNIHGLSLTV